MTLRACVVGSTNVDLVLRVPALPRPGETVLAADTVREGGGKGANQAVALARLGASVRLVSAVGSDADGLWSLDLLRTEGVDTSAIAVVDAPTGLAVVAVDPAGENHIVVAPGANALVRPPASVDADVLLLSLEIPLPTVLASAVLARERAVPVVLNAAPAQALPPGLLDAVAVLVVNESEWAALGEPSAARAVVTRGGAGCRVLEDGHEVQLPAVPVGVVDTTGAGDCFAAALALVLGSGQSLAEAAAFAVQAAARAVTAHGARGGLPHARDLA